VTLALITTWFALFKTGVVRHGTTVYFTCLPILVVALLGRHPVRMTRSLDGQGRIFTIVGASLLAFMSAGAVPINIVSPLHDAVHLGEELSVLASSSKTQAKIERGRLSLQRAYAVPTNMLALVKGHTVDIDPWEQQVAWAYPQIRWDPLPVTQNYAAYTTYLDDLDRKFLDTTAAPQFILRTPPLGIDGVIWQFAPPDTQLEMECLYRQVAVSAQWQLLERGPSRCGAPRLLSIIQTGYGKPISVPEAPVNSDIVATFSLRVSLGWRILNVLYKPPGFVVHFNGSGPNRFIWGTASGQHVLDPAADLGYQAPFQPLGVRSMTLGVLGRPATESGITVRFYSISVSPSLPGAGAGAPGSP
jgi:hypothetical protein